MSEYLKIHPQTPSERQIEKAANILTNKGIAIYPTDTVYGIGFVFSNKSGMQRVRQILGKKKITFSFLFSDLSEINDYTRPLDKWIFKLLKKNLPGPFTFILPAGNKILKEVEYKRESIGIRIPDNNIIRSLIQKIGEPILNSSIHDEDQIVDYTTDPEIIYERFNKVIDLFIDGGFGNNNISTIVDCTADEPIILRQGLGELVY